MSLRSYRLAAVMPVQGLDPGLVPAMTPNKCSTRAERASLVRVNEQNFHAMNNDDRRGRMSSYFDFAQ
jgi:hypothetical protein